MCLCVKVGLDWFAKGNGHVVQLMLSRHSDNQPRLISITLFASRVTNCGTHWLNRPLPFKVHFSFSNWNCLFTWVASPFLAILVWHFPKGKMGGRKKKKKEVRFFWVRFTELWTRRCQRKEKRVGYLWDSNNYLRLKLKEKKNVMDVKVNVLKRFFFQ